MSSSSSSEENSRSGSDPGGRTSGDLSRNRAAKMIEGQQFGMESLINHSYLDKGRSDIFTYCTPATSAVRKDKNFTARLEGPYDSTSRFEMRAATRNVNATGSGSAQGPPAASAAVDRDGDFNGAYVAGGGGQDDVAAGGKAKTAETAEQETRFEETRGRVWGFRELCWKVVKAHCETVREKQRQAVLQLQDPQFQRKLQQQLSYRRALREAQGYSEKKQVQDSLERRVRETRRTKIDAAREWASVWRSVATTVWLSTSDQRANAPERWGQERLLLLTKQRQKQQAENKLSRGCYRDEHVQMSFAAAVVDLFRVYRDLVSVRAAASTARRALRGVDVGFDGDSRRSDTGIAPLAMDMASRERSMSSAAPALGFFAFVGPTGDVESSKTTGGPLFTQAHGGSPTEEKRKREELCGVRRSDGRRKGPPSTDF